MGGRWPRKNVCKSHECERKKPTKPLKEQNNIKQKLSEKWPQKRGRNEMDPSSEQALTEKAK